MRIRNVKKGQLAAWLFTGLSAPLAQFAGGMPWQTVCVTAGGCLTVCWLASRMDFSPPKWLCAVEYVWLICLLGSMASWISESWPAGNFYPAVPLILLTLGGIAASRGTESAARAGSTLFWLIALIYVAVITAGVGEMDIRELSGSDRTLDKRAVVALLIPALTVFWEGRESKLPLLGMIGILLFAVLLSVLITGALSLRVAVNAEAPLHEWVGGLTLAGVLQRFEAVVSVALTIGWFALLSFLLCAAGQQMNREKRSKGSWVAALGAGVLVMIKKGINTDVLVLGCVFLWVLVPAVLMLLGRNKKSQISKNNA